MRRAFLKHIIVAHTVALLIFGAGCQAPIRHLTPSGRPEVTITRRVGDQVAARITNRMLNAGYNVKTATKTLMAFEKRVDNFLYEVLFSSDYDRNPAWRITYTIVETKVSTRVVASLSVITNPGSAFERVTSMDNSKDSLSIQQFLTELKNSFENP